MRKPVFFSHRFGDARLNQVIQLVRGIAGSLSVECTNVDSASHNTPIDRATELIENSDFVVALCSRDVAIEGGKFRPSDSVIQEITIAYAKGKPIVCFVEEGTEISGFFGNMFTYKNLQFDAESILAAAPDFVKGIQDGIAATQKNGLADGGRQKAYTIPSIEMQVTLHEGLKGYFWEYVIERTYRFDREMVEPFRVGAWALPYHEIGMETLPIAEFELIRPNSTRDFKLLPSLVPVGKQGYEGRINVEPAPSKGDLVCMRERWRAACFNVIFQDAANQAGIEVDGVKRVAFDGAHISNSIEKLHIRFAFPRGYLIAQPSVLVSTFVGSPGRLNLGEMERVQREGGVQMRNFNKSSSFELTVDRPLFQYFYGFCWNPPDRTEFSKGEWAGAPLGWDD